MDTAIRCVFRSVVPIHPLRAIARHCAYPPSGLAPMQGNVANDAFPRGSRACPARVAERHNDSYLGKRLCQTVV